MSDLWICRMCSRQNTAPRCVDCNRTQFWSEYDWITRRQQEIKNAFVDLENERDRLFQKQKEMEEQDDTEEPNENDDESHYGLGIFGGKE